MKRGMHRLCDLYQGSISKKGMERQCFMRVGEAAQGWIYGEEDAENKRCRLCVSGEYEFGTNVGERV
jgi:hypothetical protein